MSVGGGAVGGVMVEVLVVVVEGGGHSVAVASVPVGEDDKRRGRGERVIVALFCSVLFCSALLCSAHQCLNFSGRGFRFV